MIHKETKMVCVIALLLVSLALQLGPRRVNAHASQPFPEHFPTFATSCASATQGVEVVLEMQTAGTGRSTADALAADVEVVKRRLAGFGATATVQPDLNFAQIHVFLSSVPDPDKVVRLLVQTALFEIIDPNGQYLPPGTVVTTTLGGPLTPDGTATTQGPIYKTTVSGRDVESWFPTTNSLGQFVVGFKLNAAAAETFVTFTSANLRRPMSIVLDKIVISSPMINGAISDQGIIEGMPLNDVRGLVVELNSGPLAAPLRAVQYQTAQMPCSSEVSDPQTLLDLLANTPIDQSELPAGFGPATIAPAPSDVVQNFTAAGLTNLAGVVGAKIDDNTVFFYLVFTDAASAQAGMSAHGDAVLRQGMQASSANGAIDQPWGCYAADASGQSIGLCMEQYANVLVVALSAVPSNPSQAMANATDLTTAGVNHLKRVLTTAS